MSKKLDGRDAIKWIKDAYESGTEFANTAAIAHALIQAFGVKPQAVLGKAADWDRQARYEREYAGKYTTAPFPQKGYRRRPNAAPRDRAESIQHLHKHSATRERNLGRHIAVAAAQPDAQPSERGLNRLYVLKQTLDAQIDETIRELIDERKSDAPQLVLVPSANSREIAD